jgi:hypothetical protein
MKFKTAARRLYYDLYQEQKVLKVCDFRKDGIFVVIWDKPITMFYPHRLPLIDQLIEAGFILERMIDCTQRSTDRADNFIYHLRLPIDRLELDQVDRMFIASYSPMMFSAIEDFLQPEWLKELKLRIDIHGWKFSNSSHSPKILCFEKGGVRIELSRVPNSQGQKYSVLVYEEKPDGTRQEIAQMGESDDPVRLLKFVKQSDSFTHKNQAQ